MPWRDTWRPLWDTDSCWRVPSPSDEEEVLDAPVLAHISASSCWEVFTSVYFPLGALACPLVGQSHIWKASEVSEKQKRRVPHPAEKTKTL